MHMYLNRQGGRCFYALHGCNERYVECIGRCGRWAVPYARLPSVAADRSSLGWPLCAFEVCGRTIQFLVGRASIHRSRSVSRRVIIEHEF